MIEYVESHVVYENAKHGVRSRHAFFPGVVQLASGELVALFVIGEAFESADQTTYVSRSKDLGRTWELQGPLYEKSKDSIPTSDYLKPQVLNDGTLIALGYRFHRHDSEQSIADPKTDGILPGDNIVSFSTDDGRTWSVPRVISRNTPELLEIASRCAQLSSGDIVATAGLLKMPDGSNPSGQFGVLLRSRDGGQTWDDRTHFFKSPTKTVAAYESHVCEMQPGRLVAICWAFDLTAGEHHPNQVTVSHDHGQTWSVPINTAHTGEAANLLSLGGECLMSIHCQRRQDVGLHVRVVDFSRDRWNVMAEKDLLAARSGQRAISGERIHDYAAALRFGQASLLRLNNGDILATHWCIEDGQGKIRTHRLRLLV